MFNLACIPGEVCYKNSAPRSDHLAISEQEDVLLERRRTKIISRAEGGPARSEKRAGPIAAREIIVSSIDN